MSIVFLNGEYMPVEQAKISPLDRGFLFGDGIYEVIPSCNEKMIGFKWHIDRMNDGLKAIGIDLNWKHDKWQSICEQLSEKNGSGSLGIYLHISRGADTKRFHAFPEGVEPTVFAMAFKIPQLEGSDLNHIKGYALASTLDLRWKRCQIKSTALLGNVLHFQEGYEAGCQETLLFNDNGELTEASSSNVFIVKNEVIATSIQDNQILPGITRRILLDVLRKDGSFKVEERIITLDEVKSADEVWITSSSKEVAPVTHLDDLEIGSGQLGHIWFKAASLYAQHKFNY
ncbi:D-alanine aminotransferase [Moritella sp. JT01]|uniref:aminotransferase class IV n=1 Tax=Moritella sp. JT01 TaxID=756698 RepID=UPI000793F4D5|nr:aminotransferase class IV [Moritella sp. JT01]KXO07130.1 D-alanine aminotransferase [Moritella sp. JT01]